MTTALPQRRNLGQPGLMLAGLLALTVITGQRAGAVPLFSETFNTNTATTAETVAAYPDLTFASSNPGIYVDNGVLKTPAQGAGVTLPVVLSGPTVLSVDIGSLSGSTNFPVGAFLMGSSVAFHPGLSGGMLRVDGVFGNTHMGFTPASGVLHHLTVSTDGAGNFDLTLIDGANASNVFTKSWFNPVVTDSAGVWNGAREGMFDNIQITSSPDTTAPVISSLSPADNATGVDGATNLVLNFNKGIVFGTGNITIKNLTNSTQSVIPITDAAQVSLSGSVLTINPTANLAGSKSYAIRIDAGAVKDRSNNPFAGIADDTTWNFTTAAPPVHEEILIVNEVEGFLGSTKTQVTTTHNGTTQVSYDATGVSKLVVAIGTESGFNNHRATVTGVTFNGVPLTQAVQENTIFDTTPPLPGDYDGGTAAIFFLDNPFQGAATFMVSATTSAGGLNGGWVSIIGLSGTAAGVGNTAASWATQASSGNVSTGLTTSANDSLVIAMVENSGRQSSAGTPTPVSPLTLSNNGYWGSQWGSGASAYQSVATSGTTITPTFTTNAGGNIHTIAAEFLAKEIPAAANYATWTTGPFQGALGNTDAEIDFDGGGLQTGIEWVVGGDPTKASDDAGLAPTFDNTTDPSYFIFTYRRTDDANSDSKTSIAAQYGINLGGWITASHDGDNIIITETNDFYATGVDKVEVRIKKSLAPGGRLFARLNVVVAAP